MNRREAIVAGTGLVVAGAAAHAGILPDITSGVENINSANNLYWLRIPTWEGREDQPHLLRFINLDFIRPFGENPKNLSMSQHPLGGNYKWGGKDIGIVVAKDLSHARSVLMRHLADKFGCFAIAYSGWAPSRWSAGVGDDFSAIRAALELCKSTMCRPPTHPIDDDGAVLLFGDVPFEMMEGSEKSLFTLWRDADGHWKKSASILATGIVGAVNATMECFQDRQASDLLEIATQTCLQIKTVGVEILFNPVRRG
jgi:hypothetical protein